MPVIRVIHFTRCLINWSTSDPPKNESQFNCDAFALFGPQDAAWDGSRPKLGRIKVPVAVGRSVGRTRMTMGDYKI